MNPGRKSGAVRSTTDRAPEIAGVGALLLSGLAGAVLLIGCTAPTVTAEADGTVVSPEAGGIVLADGSLDVENMSPFGSYLAGRYAQSSGDFPAASAYLGRTLADDPANPDLLDRAINATLISGDVDAAMAFAESRMEIDDQSPLASLVLATSSARAGAFDKAEAWLRASPETGINRYFVPFLLAWSKVGQDKGEDAFEVLKPLAELTAIAAQHDYHVGLIGDILGRDAQAETGYTSAVGAVRGGTLRPVLAAGSYYERHGKGDEARAIYEAFLSANPETLYLEPTMRRLQAGQPAEQFIPDAKEGFAEALFGAATLLYQDNAYDPALAFVNLALSVAPDLDIGWMLAGDLQMASDDDDRAVESFRSVSADSRMAWAVRLRLAGALDATGEVDEAVEILRAMALERPERSGPLITLGEILRTKERYEEAVEVYDQAIARIPKLDNRHWSLLYARGMSLERTKQWDRAEADFLHALELEPDQPLVLNYLGYSWVELGENLDEARGMIERAVEQRPNDGYIVDSLGWVLFRLGDFKTAVSHLERAVEIRPNDPVIIDHFGDVLWRVGRKDEARFQWMRALVFEPEEDLIETIEFKLRDGLEPEEPPKEPIADSSDL